MVPSEDTGSLRHNSRHKKRRESLTLADLFSPKTLSRLESSAQDIDILLKKFREWHIDPGDPRTNAVLNRLEKIWPSLAKQDRIALLETGESIAEAEKAKRVWKLRATRQEYVNVAKCIIAAAQLEKQIRALFPPPWDGVRACIAELSRELAAFIEGSLLAVVPNEKDLRLSTARTRVRSTKQRLSKKTGRFRWELVGEIAWLASRGEVDPDERTVRRYLEEQQTHTTPGGTHFRRNWSLLRDFVSIPPSKKSRDFEVAAKSYLNSLFSITSEENPAK